MEQSSGISSDDSEDAGSDAALVIAESDESASYPTKGQRGSAKKRGTVKKDPTYAPRQGGGRKKPPARNDTSAAKKKKPVNALRF